MAHTGTGKMVFTCASCGYRARIPESYSGKKVTCPGCRQPQLAKAPTGAEPAETGYTAMFPKIQTPPEDDKFVFVCMGCSYRARIPGEYLGKNIHCPACKRPQVASAAEPSPSSGMTGMHAKVHIAPITPVPAPVAAPVKKPELSGAAPDRIVMTCVKCSYRARIPAKYVGISVHCPNCNAVNVPKVTEVGSDSISRKTHSDKLIAAAREGAEFLCGQCGYSGRISSMVASGTIYCPACRAPQSLDAAAGQRRSLAPEIAASALSPRTPRPPARAEAQTDTDSDLLPMNAGSELEAEEAAEAEAEASEAIEEPRRSASSARRPLFGRHRPPAAAESEDDAGALDDGLDDDELGPSMAHSPSVRYFIQVPKARFRRPLIVTIMFLVTGAVLAAVWYQQHRQEGILTQIAPQGSEQRESARLRAELERTLKEQEALRKQLEEAGKANLELLKKSVASPAKPISRSPSRPSGSASAPYVPVDASPSQGPSRVVLGDNLEPEDNEPVY